MADNNGARATREEQRLKRQAEQDKANRDQAQQEHSEAVQTRAMENLAKAKAESEAAGREAKPISWDY